MNEEREPAAEQTAGQTAKPSPRPSPSPSPPPHGETLPVPAKADPVKRFLAALVDGIAAAIVMLVFSIVIPILGFFIGILLAAAYMLVRDGLSFEFMDHRSLGKKLLKLRPVRLDGGALDLNDSMKRNWVFALPNALQVIPILGTILGGLLGLVLGLVECVLVLTDPEGRRWGDRLANTRVIEVEN